ncbi:MAG TPA: M23 family metallopeptidase [Longimicrobium sp.]|jgi:murein DD-endopeptidase MepM/ murein hydrolase activator NlpD
MRKYSLLERTPFMPALTVAAVAVLALGVFAAWADAGPAEAGGVPAALPAVHAIPVTTDTLLLGGYASGSFAQALTVLASDLSPSEREMIGRHLDKMYLPLLQGRALKGGGRLRLAYERTMRPDGSTRSIQVLAAQAAVGGSMYTVFLYDQGEKPGYYDDWGRSLDPVPWTGPLPSLRVTSPFRMDRMHPILRRILPHTGVDLAAGYGTPVRAAADGSVSYAAVKGGYGNLVEVRHPNGYATRYAHLSSIAHGVYNGVPVRQGDVIGYVGSTGLATGPHLHYEVRRKGVPVDPMSFQPTATSSADVGYDPVWRRERTALGRILARAPSLTTGGTTVLN